MSTNISVSEVSGGEYWAYSGHALKFKHFNTDYTTMGIAMETSHTFAENYQTLPERPPKYFEYYIHISF